MTRDLPGPSTTRTIREFKLRKAVKADAKEIVDLVVGLARFERLSPPDARGRVRLVKDIFDRRLVNVLVADSGKELLGYALYFYTYSSFRARPTLYLEDIFVPAKARSKGVGEALFVRCKREAERNGCGRMEWAVLAWNRRAMRFYERFGAQRIPDQNIFRLNLQPR